MTCDAGDIRAVVKVAGNLMGRSRGTALAHLLVVAAILVLAGSVALAAPVPTPPQVAELAPAVRQAEADEQDQEPEPEEDEPEDPAAGIDRSSVRRCVGDPPRQTEDPLAPPCVAFWDGEDNGGATMRGVSDTQINIVMPGGIDFLTKGSQALINHFNSRYEFYGRQLHVEYMTTGEWLETLNPSQFSEYAERIDTEFDAFAVPFRISENVDGSIGTFKDLLAERGIITVSVGAGFRTEEQLSGGEYAAYQWAFEMTDDKRQQNVAEWVCKNLVGRPAIHAGDELTDETRQFGVLVQRTPSGAPMNADVLVAALEACDAPVAATEELNFEHGGLPLVPGATTGMAQLRSEGVTSILCICTTQFLAQGAMPAAEELGWYPEWVSTATADQAEDVNISHFWPPEQRAHFFGPQNTPKVIPFTEAPWYLAAREGDPTITPAYARDQHANWARTTEGLYYSLLILATGIQGAGPNLTPETFAQALREAEFPNPGAGGPPVYQPRGGFGVGDNSFTDDLGLVYWDSTARAIDDPRLGTFCYVNGGQRYALGEWPSDTDEKFHTEGRPADVPCR